MSKPRISKPGETLPDTLQRLKAERDAKIVPVAVEWDAKVAPVKATLDAMPDALRLKAEADKAYALSVRPIWEAYDKARETAREEADDNGEGA